MENSAKLVGQAFAGYVLKSVVAQDADSAVYHAESKEKGMADAALVKYTKFPTQGYRQNVLATMSGDVGAVDSFFNREAKHLQEDLTKVQGLSHEADGTLMELKNFYIGKQTGGNAYDVFVSTEEQLPFKSFVAQNGLSVRDAITLGKNMLKGLCALHDAGVLHGNLCDDALYVTDNRQFKLGVVSFVRPQVGSLAYLAKLHNGEFAAPEVLSGTEYDKQSEVYAVGMLLYKLFNNQKTPVTQQTDGVCFTAAPARAPECVAQVILRALSDRAERYPAVAAFLEALEDAEKQLTAQNLAEPLFVAASRVKQVAKPAEKAVETTAKKPKSKAPLLIGIIAGALALLLAAGVAMWWYCIRDTGSKYAITLDIEDVFVEKLQTAEVMIYADSEDTDLSLLTVAIDDVSVADISFDAETGTVTVYGINVGTTKMRISTEEEGTLEIVPVEVTPIENKVNVEQLDFVLDSSSDYSIYIKDLKDDKAYITANSEHRMGASAMIVLPILYTLDKQMDIGYIDMDSDVWFEYTYPGRGIYKEDSDETYIMAGQMARSMMQYSDNNCINSLMNFLTLETMQNTMDNAGMKDTRIVRTLSANASTENQTSARDVGEMFALLMNSTNNINRDFLMENFTIWDNTQRSGLGKYVPSSATFLNLNAITDNKYHEIMYVEDQGEQFLVVFMSDGTKKSAVNKGVAAEVGRIVYDSFMQAAE